MRKPKWEVAFGREFLTGPLRPAEKAIILALAGWCDRDWQCNATKEQLAEGSGVCERQLRGHLKRLREKGYITFRTIQVGSKCRNIYRLLSPCNIRRAYCCGEPLQFLPQSLHKNNAETDHDPKKRQTGDYRITLFPTEAMTKPHSELAKQNLQSRPEPKP